MASPASTAALDWSTYLVAAGATVAAFLMAWPVLVRTRREAAVDALWALAIPALVVVAALTSEGWAPRRGLAVVVSVCWGLRLAGHLARRLAAESDDGRYRAMREALGGRHLLAMGPFFLAQGLMAAALALPWWSVAADTEPRWRWLEGFGLAVWILGFAGTALADRQLARWRAEPSHRGRTCRAGLWGWSRHPNYFFEWIGWCGVALIAWPAPAGWTGAAAALLLLLMLTRVSGIPFTEQQALRSRGDDYRAYQREVSAFVPLPRCGAGT
jgi:steroid 5-alpha reductase family enzyme